MKKLEGKVAMVTGGSEGIGKACALKLATNGADIVIADRNVEQGKKAAAEIQALGRRATFQEVNLWEYPSVKDMAHRAIAEMGKIDICVACGASTPQYAKLFHEQDPLTDYVGCLNSQQFARLYTIRALLDHMREQNYGKIVIITSDAGRVATPRESLIGSAAAGLVTITKVLAGEFARWNIRVNCLSLTLIENTPAQKGVEATMAAHIFKKARERARLGIPTAEDVASAALFFALPESDRITGQILSVNGGLSFAG